jgi:helicase
VIVTGCHRGLSEVENYDIQQMIGRAGRPKYDPRGDAYILVPESEKDVWIKKLKTKPEIRSTLLDYVGKEDNPHYKVLAFHIVAEIHQGNVKTKDGFKDWFRKSLAHFQDQAFDDALIDATIEQLQQCRAVMLNESGEYECTAIGKVASMFYYSPFDVSDLRRNFKFLFDEKREADDYAVSIALGNIDSFRWSICNKFEREAIAQYQGKIDKMFGVNQFTAGVLKHGAAFYYLLKGRRDIPQIAALQGVLSADMERTMQVLNAIDTMSCKWDKQSWFRTIGLRLRYGVESDLVELCQIPNVGQARAKRLKAARVKTLEEFVACSVDSLASMMKVSKKLAEESLEAAKLIQLKESL